MNPSTRPYAEYLGEQEYYRFRAETPAGVAAKSLFLSRGDVIDVGDVAVR